MMGLRLSLLLLFFHRYKPKRWGRLLAVVFLLGHSAAYAVDYGDAPMSYGNASATTSTTYFLGTTATDNDGTAPTAAFNGNNDDTTGSDDEDGVYIPTVTQGYKSFITVKVNGTGGYLQGWADWNGNGVFDTDEQIATDIQDNSASDINASTGVIEISVLVPITATTTTTYARFRWSNAAGVTATATGATGEVEDYAITVKTAPSATPFYTGTPPSTCTFDNDIWYNTQTQLRTYNVSTNADTLKRSLARSYGDIAWGVDGKLYGIEYISGVGTPSPNTFAPLQNNNPTLYRLYQIDPATSAETLLYSGNEIAFANSLTSDNKNWLYFGSGFQELNTTPLTTGYAQMNNRIYRYQPGGSSAPQLWIDLGDYGYGNGQSGGDFVFMGNHAYVMWTEPENSPSTSKILKVGPLDSNNAVTASTTVTSLGTAVANLYGLTGNKNGTLYTISGADKSIYKINVSPYSVTAAGTATGAAWGLTSKSESASLICSVSGDHGDAPASYGDAQHVINGSSTHYLGSNVPDSEAAAATPLNGTGDDATGTDDEDGVSIPSLTQGQTATITATVTGAGGYLQGWIDWNGNGVFDASEQVATNLQDNGTGDTNAATGTIAFSVSVPATAVTTATYARFRWSSTNNLDTTIAASNGEVEDYPLTIVASVAKDYSDAPASYGTPFHPITAGVYLGATIDAETAPPTPLDGTGDDVTDSDDEDGITFLNTAFSGGTITAYVHGTGGYLQGWIDWNRDGDFNDAGEQIATNLQDGGALDTNTNTDEISFPVTAPAGYSPGASYARFRWSTTNNLTPTGSASDGEVEDYPVTLVAQSSYTCPTSGGTGGYATSGTGLYKSDIFWFDWSCGSITQFNPGDTVTKSWTLPNGAVVTGVISNITDAMNPYNTGDWTGDLLDDLYGGVNPIGLKSAYEQQYSSPDPAFNLQFTATLNGTTISPGFVMAEAEDLDNTNESLKATTDGDKWQPIEGSGNIDAQFSADGKTITMSNVTADEGSLLIAASSNAQNLSVVLNAGGTSAAAFGTIVPFDYGDAPASYGMPAHFVTRVFTGGSQPTTLTALSGLTMATGSFNTTKILGTVLDTEITQATPLNGTGDDTTDTNDEDGTTLPSLVQGQTASISVNVTGTGYLQGWIDWNGDGDFDDAGEQVATNLQDNLSGDNNATAGTIAFDITVPSNAVTTATYARLRWSSTAGLSVSALAADGEVEDYPLTITTPPKDYGDAPATYGDAWHTIVPGTHLGAVAPDAETSTGTPQDGTGDNATGTNDEESALFYTPFSGGTVMIKSAPETDSFNPGAGYLQAWIDWNRDGDFDDTGEQIATDLIQNGPLDTEKEPTGTHAAIAFMVTPPASYSAGASYLRVRWSSQAGLGPTGGASDGEVEDYPITLAAPVVHNCPASTGDGGFAIGGTGLYKSELFWLDWSCGATTEFNVGDTVNKSWTLANGTVVTAQITDITDRLTPVSINVVGTTGTPAASLKDEYAITGGAADRVGLANYLYIPGLSTDPQFKTTFSVTINGVSVPPHIATAESERVDGPREAFTATTSGLPWEILEGRGSINATFSSDGKTVVANDTTTTSPSVLVFASEQANNTTLTVRGAGRGSAALAVVLPFDYSDAPATFGTPSHYLARDFSGSSRPTTQTPLAGLTMATAGYDLTAYLGSNTLDGELSSQPTATADGDDANGVDDEDISTLPSLTQGQTATISTTATGAGGYLQAWFDWNGDGDFDDAGEQVATDLQDNGTGDTNPAAGTLAFNMTVPSSAVTTPTFARLRWSSTSGLNAVALATDGEVEDYAVTVSAGIAPVITSDSGGATAAVSMPENQTVATTVTATDANVGDTQTYSITGGVDATKFAIDASTGVLTFVTAPDFEVPTDTDTNNVYDVQVTVTDGMGLTDVQDIAVTVTDVAENVAPVITSNGGLATAPVSAAENQTAVTTVTATDANAGDTLTYSITGGADSTKFAIDASTGVLTFVAAPDFEVPTDVGTDNVYDVQVTVTDNGSLTDVQDIAVTVTDVAENVAPVITSNGGAATAPVSAAENQTAVTTVTATDANAGDTLTYSISGGADAAKFAIDSSTGVLTFVTAPDFEVPTDVGTDNVYDVQVTVTDNGSLTDVQDIAVTVTDVAENVAPVITSNSGGATASTSAAENQTAVTTVTATDANAGDTLTYSITGGADAAKFAIDGSTGVLTFVTAPDFETPTDVGTDNVYDVQVTVTDNGSLTDVQDIAVTVTDVAENVAPVITSNSGGATASTSAAENQTAVTTVTATDANAGDTLTYSITGGADSVKFAIDASTGVLTFVAAPDFEVPTDVGTDNVYDVQVTVTDNGSLTDVQDIAVTVTDVAEVSSVQVQVKALLQGPYAGSTGLMQDSLRSLNLIPMTQPYSIAPFNYAGTETVSLATLATTGSSAVVDWVLVELRTTTASSSTVATQAVLLLRDGSIADASTGSTNLTFNSVSAGDYYVAVRHRNHLGVLTASAVTLSSTPSLVDFTLTSTPTYGTDARLEVGTQALLWGGDANMSNQVIAAGPGDDNSSIIGILLTHPANSSSSSNYRLNGYLKSDLDLNGITLFAGPGNDVNLLMGNVILHPANTTGSANFIIGGHLPLSQ